MMGRVMGSSYNQIIYSIISMDYAISLEDSPSASLSKTSKVHGSYNYLAYLKTCL